ncbi:MAG: RsiV family protein [Spirochaetaceae bacterium]|nr:RsiV family protein [Spirochaetaceae bacterium]
MYKKIVFSPDRGEKSPQLDLSLLLLEPAGNKLLQKLLYGDLSPEEYTERLIQNYKNSYKEILNQEEAVPDLPAAVLDWTYEEIHGVHTYSHLQVIDRTREYYTGGAHGMREKAYFVIDLAEKKQIRLKDLFLKDAEGALKTRIEDALRIYSGLEAGVPLSTGDYFEDSVKSLENFYLTAQGIGFHWDPYEIAPYSVGPIEILIPYEEVGELLNSQGKSLISQFN